MLLPSVWRPGCRPRPCNPSAVAAGCALPAAIQSSVRCVIERHLWSTFRLIAMPVLTRVCASCFCGRSALRTLVRAARCHARLHLRSTFALSAAVIVAPYRIAAAIVLPFCTSAGFRHCPPVPANLNRFATCLKQSCLRACALCSRSVVIVCVR